MNYALIDSGEGEKLERFGPYLIVRPAAQAVWKRKLSHSRWEEADARFTRESGERWHIRTALPASWQIEVEGISFKIAPTDFGHLGIFPEHCSLWQEFLPLIQRAQKPVKLLNLFAYSGGATLAAAKAGASVCHLDASKAMVAWARENAQLSGLEKAPIRWIIDDVNKFLAREIKRGLVYDAIILDPPSFGRGARGEVFKIEKDLAGILEKCRRLLVSNPLFVLLTSHTAGFTPTVMSHLIAQTFPAGKILSGEMLVDSATKYALPSGSYAMVRYES